MRAPYIVKVSAASRESGHNADMAKLLGIDVGTSGAKAVLVDEQGRVLAQASSEYPLSVPRPLWAEQDPEDWWAGVQSCLEQLGERDPDAIGLTGQMHGSVFLDAQDRVVRPAILWCDQRTSAESAEIDRLAGAERVREITCNPPLTGFQAPKALWLRNHEPEAYSQVRSLLLPKDYIRMRLTGVKATEVSDASGTSLLDVRSRRWSGELLAALGIAQEWMPDVFESDEPTGSTLASGYLRAGVPVVGGGGDQAAGAVGTGAVERGVVSVSLGTSGVVFSALDEPKPDPTGAAHVFCHANRAWHAMGVMLSCGGALRWYRDTLCPGMDYDAIAAEACLVPAGAEGLAFTPYLTGERCPHQDPLARAGFNGVTLGHTRAHFSRAVFEGASFGLKDCMERLEALGASADELRVTGGGAKSKFWMQMLADLFGKPCATLEVDEGPAYGAALLAGAGVGIFGDIRDACRSLVRVRSTVEPGSCEYGEALTRWRSLYPALATYHRTIT